MVGALSLCDSVRTHRVGGLANDYFAELVPLQL